MRFRVRPDWHDDEWDALLATLPEATFFHTRNWARVVSRAFPACTDRSVWFRDEETGRDFLMPLFAWKRVRGLFSTLQSSFPFCYGGPIPLDQETRREILRRFHSRHRSFLFSGNPFVEGIAMDANTGVRPTNSARSTGAPAIEADADVGATNSARSASAQAIDATLERSRFAVIEGFRVAIDWTHVRPLPAVDPESGEQDQNAAEGNDLRRLARRGLDIAESRLADDVSAVYELYRASFPRWGGAPAFVHPASYYQALVAEGGDAVRFTVARARGQIAGGLFVIRWNGKAHYLGGYFDMDASALRPSAHLQVESIRSATAAGCHSYDFLPSGGQAGVEEFKRRLGGVRVAFPIYEHRGLLHRLSDPLRPRAVHPRSEVAEGDDVLSRSGGDK